jgi:hypothetical protein
MMADSSDQSKLIAGLRNVAENHAAKDPTFAKLRALGKTLVDETRKRFNQGEASVTLGACLLKNNEVQLILPNAQNESAQSEIVATLQRLAASGQILGGACSTILPRPLVPNGPTVPFIDVHTELVDGLAVRSAVPADLSILEKGVPGVKGPFLPAYATKVEPRIFSRVRNI